MVAQLTLVMENTEVYPTLRALSATGRAACMSLGQVDIVSSAPPVLNHWKSNTMSAHLSGKDGHLYGAKAQKKPTGKEISSSTSLAFSSQLSSLIANGKNPREKTSIAKPRPKKEDIFSTHNRNTKKRALKDIDDVDFTQQKHATSSEALDPAAWHRAKRKMEEKARLYSAMKRGDVEDLDERYAVDFDRKWAEAQDNGESDEEIPDEVDPDSDEELVEYVDEFGRNRKGTKREAAMEERKKATQAADTSDRFTARPNMPTNVIYGDTIQSAAFNPDDTVAQQMAEIAAKRDHDTPPPDTHFDSKQEIRTKGVGFMQFSANAEERKRQMANLEAERKETELRRSDAARRKEERKREIEERRKKIAEKRTEKKTDKFLSELGGELGDFGASDEKET